MITVLLVDDHTMVRKGLSMMLKQHADIRVVGETDNGRDSILLAQQLKPDVVLMDLSMPTGMSGFGAIREIRLRCPEVQIVILTMYDEEGYIKQALQLGVQGYILKNGKKEELIEAVRSVHQRRQYYSTSFNMVAFKENQGVDSSDSISSILTFREQEIVRHIVLGYTNREMANKLQISIKTVENHRTNIMLKLNIQSKRELIQYALKNKYLDLSV